MDRPDFPFESVDADGVISLSRQQGFRQPAVRVGTDAGGALEGAAHTADCAAITSARTASVSSAFRAEKGAVVFMA